MSEKKIIAVVGATGAQGGGLVRAILNNSHNDFAVRALTRDANSDTSKALAALGAEVVEADVDNVGSLKSAFEGAYGVFGVTFFWHHFSPEQELQQAKNIADAAKAVNAKHVIWSTLEDSREYISLDDNRMPTLMGQYKVPHFDSKGAADNYFLELGLPVSILRTSFYWDNFIHFGLGPQKMQDGSYAITFPLGEAKLPGIASEDIGKCALGIFSNPNEYIGKTLGIAGEFVSGNEMAKGLSKALGINVVFNDVPPEIYRGFGFPGAEDMGNMFQFKRDFNQEYMANRNIQESRKINPELQDFSTWLNKYGSSIPFEK
jgi:uncharacterized protein YbjT (DUF2867 family)